MKRFDFKYTKGSDSDILVMKATSYFRLIACRIEYNYSVDFRLFGRDFVVSQKFLNQARNTWYTGQRHVYMLFVHMDRSPQYYINWGRDCDGVESSRSVSFDNALEAHKFIEDAYKWADGPESWTKCTKEEYEEYESTYRDLGMEAYENGHPHILRP